MARPTSTSIVLLTWRPVVLTGVFGYPAAFAAFSTVTQDSTALAAACALFGMAIVAAVAVRRMLSQYSRMHSALNNMSQGLCMFDRNERLLMCNKRYVEIYRLSPEITKPGTTVTAVLEYRAANGTFMRDPSVYLRELVDAMARLITQMSLPPGDLTSAVVVSPRAMAGGGWVGSHDDITEQRDAELERASMQEQQQRRSV